MVAASTPPNALFYRFRLRCGTCVIRIRALRVNMSAPETRYAERRQRVEAALVASVASNAPA